MRNMKISRKLIISFLIVIALAVLVAGVGFVGMQRINAADNALYENELLAIDAIGRIKDNFSMQQVLTRNLVIYDREEELYEISMNQLTELERRMEQDVADYQQTVTAEDEQQRLNSFLAMYEGVHTDVKQQTIAYVEAGKIPLAIEMLDASANDMVAMNALLEESISINSTQAKAAVEENNRLFVGASVLEVSVLAAAILVALVLAVYIAGIIGRPIGRISTLMNQVGLQGELDVADEIRAEFEKDLTYKDEVGQSILSFKHLIGHIGNISDALRQIADQDLSGNVELLSDRDELGVSLVTMQTNLSSMLSNIREAAQQVSMGAQEIAQASQNLAMGSTEQASTIEQFSNSMNKIQEMAENSLSMADNALHEVTEADRIMGESTEAMGQMLEAMQEINTSSHDISNVIKVIDDLAFQTNILALNAAVEAARAGQYGKGFAVVAEEVRNLASKSAEAAKETEQLIGKSLENVARGNVLVKRVNNSLKDVGVIEVRNAALIRDISGAIQEQTESIANVAEGIGQLSSVIHANSATAEETAALSQQMSAQANVLNGAAEQFKLKDAEQGGGPEREAPVRSREPAAHMALTR